MDTLDPYTRAVTSGERKAAFLETMPDRYFLSAIQAGAYLTIVVFVFWTIRQLLGAEPSAKLLSSMFFGVGLSIIIFTGTELFTSNNMYLTMSTLAGKTRAAASVKLWAVCWLGNFVGAAIVAALLYAAHCLTGLTHDHVLMSGAYHKTEMPFGELFFRGILANWIVCLAVWVNLHLHEEMARIVAVILIVFIFLLLGGEHSIANMGTFAIAFFADPALPIDGVAYNLLGSTLGNIVGGGFGVGALAWAANRKRENDR